MKVTHTVNATVHLRLNAEGTPRFLITTSPGMEVFYGKFHFVFPLTIEYDYREAIIGEIDALQKEIKAFEDAAGVKMSYLTEEERKILLEQSKKTSQSLQLILDSLPVEHTPQACASAQEPCPIHSPEGAYQL